MRDPVILLKKNRTAVLKTLWENRTPFKTRTNYENADPYARPGPSPEATIPPPPSPRVTNREISAVYDQFNGRVKWSPPNNYADSRSRSAVWWSGNSSKVNDSVRVCSSPLVFARPWRECDVSISTLKKSLNACYEIAHSLRNFHFKPQFSYLLNMNTTPSCAFYVCPKCQIPTVFLRIERSFRKAFCFLKIFKMTLCVCSKRFFFVREKNISIECAQFFSKNSTAVRPVCFTVRTTILWFYT